MQNISYDDLLSRCDSGIIFVKLSYPVCRLRSVVTKTDYSYLGFYSFSSELGPPNIVIDLIDVFDGLLIPSWYKSTFTLEDLLLDKLIDNVYIKPCKLNKSTFQRAIKEVKRLIPKYSWEQLLKSAFSEIENALFSDSDILLSFLECLELETPVQSLKRYSPIKSIDEFLCESRVLYETMKIYFPNKNILDIISETESSLFIEKNIFQKLSTNIIKLLGEDSGFRKDLARHMMMPNDENIFKQIQNSLEISILQWNILINTIDKAFLTGELRKKDLIEILSEIEIERSTLQQYFSSEIISSTPLRWKNIEYASNITFDEITNTKELNLSYLHQLISSIVNDCNKGITVKIPLDALITATNRICDNVGLPHINPVQEGSYGGILISSTPCDEKVKLETFHLSSGDITLIPTNNANLDILSLDQLRELNQQLNKKKPGRIASDYLHNLREKIALNIAKRMQKEEELSNNSDSENL